MSKHQNKEKGSPFNKILKDIDINQILSIMSALGVNKNGGNNINSNKLNNTNGGDFVRLLSDEKFMSTVSELSQNIKDKEIDPKERQKAITEAFDKIKSFMDKKE